MGQIFKRLEVKYFLNKQQYERFSDKIKKYIKPDQYGNTTINNIYYDTASFELLRKSISKPAFKEKIRLRAYGTPNINSDVFLEIKRKYNKVGYKRRIKLKLSEAYAFILKKQKPNNEQITNEIEYFINLYDIKPIYLVSYDRSAYISKNNSELRITIDTNIRSRNTNLRLEKKDTLTPLFNFEYYLMEIKNIGSIPLWLTKILSEEKIYPTSFSKVGYIYEKERGNKLCLKVF